MKPKNLDSRSKVLPLFETVIMPHMTTRRFVDPAEGETLSGCVKSDCSFVLGLTVKDKEEKEK